MSKELINRIIKALKRLIKELEHGYCDNLTDKQLNELESGFEKILKVEKEVSNGHDAGGGTYRKFFRLDFLYSLFPGKERNT